MVGPEKVLNSNAPWPWFDIYLVQHQEISFPTSQVWNILATQFLQTTLQFGCLCCEPSRKLLMLLGQTNRNLMEGLPWTIDTRFISTGTPLRLICVVAPKKKLQLANELPLHTPVPWSSSGLERNAPAENRPQEAQKHWCELLATKPDLRIALPFQINFVARRCPSLIS